MFTILGVYGVVFLGAWSALCFVIGYYWPKRVTSGLSRDTVGEALRRAGYTQIGVGHWQHIVKLGPDEFIVDRTIKLPEGGAL